MGNMVFLNVDTLPKHKPECRGESSSLNPWHCYYDVEYHRDCKEAFDSGETYSGVYTIKPDNLPPFQVSIYIRWYIL